MADDRDLQANLLVQILPDHCLQKLLGLPWDSIDEMEPEEVLLLFRLKARARHYSVAEMSRFRNAYCKVTAWFERDTLSEATVTLRTVVTFVKKIGVIEHFLN